MRAVLLRSAVVAAAGLGCVLVTAVPAGALSDVATEPSLTSCPGGLAAVGCLVVSGISSVLGGGAGPVLGAAGGAVSDAAGAVIGGAVSAASSSIFSGLTSFVVDGAVWFLTQLADVVTASTTVNVAAPWYGARYTAMAALAASFAALFLLLQAAGALVHQDPARLGRAVAMVGVAGIGAGAATAVVALLLTVSDQLSAAISTTIAGGLKKSLTGVAHGLGANAVLTGNAVVPGFAMLLLAIVVAFAALVIWVELLLREVAIYAALLFFPIALAGLAWDASRAWARKLAETLGALVFAKFVIVAVLSLAVAGLASGATGSAGVLAGVAMLVLAAMSPFVLLKLIGLLELGAAAGALEGVRSGGQRSVTQNAQQVYAMKQRSDTKHAAQTGAGLRVAGAGGAAAGMAAAAPLVGAGAAAKTGADNAARVGRQAGPSSASPPRPPNHRDPNQREPNHPDQGA